MPNHKLSVNSPTGHRGYNPSRLKVAGYSVSKPDSKANMFATYSEATKHCMTLNDLTRAMAGLAANAPLPREIRWRVIPMTEAQEPYAHGGSNGSRWHSTKTPGEMETEYD